jgi:hypothetical protein
MPPRAKFGSVFAALQTLPAFGATRGATSRFGPGWLAHEGPIANLGHDSWRRTSARFQESSP